MSDQAPVKIEDILILEFGISPEKKAKELAEQYGEEHITQTLVVAREYIETLQQRGDKVANVGGIARKAIEEGWKPQESVIEIEYQEQQKTIATAQEQKKQQEATEFARKELKRQQAMDTYGSMGQGEQEAFLADFREYLVGTGNTIVVKRYDEGGIVPGPVEAMLKEFAVVRLG